MATLTVAGIYYATHGEPMIAVYVFYSMFGFQRAGLGPQLAGLGGGGGGGSAAVLARQGARHSAGCQPSMM